MGIGVVWQDESGRELSLERSHCLQYIDPAGDVTFNQWQLPRLVNELEEAAAAQLEARKLRDNALAVLVSMRGCVRNWS